MLPLPISIEPYLAEYYTAKYGNGDSEPIRISDKSDLYHVVWQVMEKRPADVPPTCHGNLVIMLPDRRCGKDPLWYNHISRHGLQLIEKRIRLEFNNDFHEYMERNEASGRRIEISDAIMMFISQYELKSISDEALKKNYYRWRMRVRPHNLRGYRKNTPKKQKNLSDRM
jgi:hypothetical protein